MNLGNICNYYLNLKGNFLEKILFFNNIYCLKYLIILLYFFSNTNARTVRNRMMKLMKSDVIRINDGDYMRELSKRIQKTYEVI